MEIPVKITVTFLEPSSKKVKLMQELLTEPAAIT
jgi:hypothetical protein